MRAVNLLPNQGADQDRRLPPPPVLVACSGIVLVTAVLAMMFLSASSKVAHAKQQLIDVQAQYAAIPAPPPPSPAVSALPAQRSTRVSALATALGERVDWDRVLREVSQVTPSNVWLLSVNAQSPAMLASSTTAAPTTLGTALPQGIVITGCTYSQDAVAVFLARLDVVPDLSDMTLGKSSDGKTVGASGGTSGGGGSGCPGGLYAFALNGNVKAGASA
jgi:Tfp pilus assembly protein PilN